ncbi:polypeptide-transport-associated protein/ ShlB-type [Synechococcus sp. NOUM97013]|nr:polypeptide-transport-associated protein/ ShlB-type [Synechococcus sp. NOUM97013]
MFPLLAQLVAPPIQPGPARIPERQSPAANDDAIQLEVEDQKEEQNESEINEQSDGQSIELEGSSPYNAERTKQILRNCELSVDTSLENSCVNQLNAQLQIDGYINTRVVAEEIDGQVKLIIIPGKLVEINVNSKNEELAREIKDKLAPLLDQPFNIIQIKNALLNLERLGIVSSLSGSIGKLGSNPTKATLNITAEVAAKPWRGLSSVRNDGNAGSGEWRGLAVLQKSDLFARGDQFQFYGELNIDRDPELGAGIGSISYTYPLSRTWGVTGSFGASRRYLVEYPKPFRDLSFRQYQGLIQTDWTFLETESTNTYIFLGVSANHNNSYYKNETFPVIAGGGIDGDLTSGYARIGLGHQGARNSLSWTGQIYALQGINSFSSPDELNNLKTLGIQPSSAQAVGAYATGLWAIDRNLIAKAVAGGQYAFNPLTSSMGFGVGSDNGLRGLPGTLISGDNGWISNLELEWSFLKLKNNQFKLVPFGGAGGITTTRLGETFSDTIGSYGMLLRWQHKNQLVVDLGWASQFNTDDNEGLWNDWIIGDGIYSKVTFQF